MKHRNASHHPSPRTPRGEVRPKKNLGQHFLTDLGVAQRIADSIEQPAEARCLPVLEVGPGMGVLTQFLLQNGRDLKVVELDGESVRYLRLHYPSTLDGRIIEADFLKLPLAEVFGGRRLAIIGNYPYNISSQIFFRVVDHRDLVPVCSGMIQKEVAERLAAAPGSKAYGILTILVQLWYDVEYLFTVGNEVFSPPPKVQSAVVRLTRNGRATLPCDEGYLRTVVKAAFSTRRKTLRNCLRSLVAEWQPDRAAVILAEPMFDLRAEQIPIEDYISLTVRLRGASA